MKKTHALILAASLVASSGAFAASGATPTCTNGRLNLVLYNKDLPSGICFSSKGEGHYCIYDTKIESAHFGTSCEDDDGATIEANTNESYSLLELEPVQIIHQLGSDFNGKIKIRNLKFTYNNGVASDNCAQVIDPNVAKCVITKSGDSQHPIYTLTISKK